MEILIGSDLVPTKVNEQEFINGEIDKILCSNLREIWFKANYRIFNLETPLIDTQHPIIKKGPNLFAPSQTINGISELKPSLITLSNNHILDQSVIGQRNTINLLNNHDINHIGAGENLTESSKPFIFNSKDKKIGVYTCAEHEFTIATNNTPGANPFDPLESLDHIAELKNKCDYTIVIYHGGKEHYRYPSPYLQKVCRKMVEKGADLVVCQHSHTIGAYEDYCDGKIIYGQGNFIFNKNKNEHWNTGLLIKVLIKDNLDIDFIPFVRTEKGIKKASQNEKKEIMTEFHKRSKQVLDQEFIDDNYNNFANENIYHYLRSISPQGKWISRIDRHLLKNKLIEKSISKNKLLSLQNYIECEAHRELFLTAIKERLKHE